MGHLVEFLRQVAAGALSGRIWSDQLGMRLFQSAQLPQQQVVFPVADERSWRT